MPKIPVSKKPTSDLSDFNLSHSKIFTEGFYRRELRLNNKNVKPFRVNFKSMSPNAIEEEIARALEFGCRHDKIEQVKADYYVYRTTSDTLAGKVLVEVASDIQTIEKQEDGSLLSEENFANIDYQLAKCISADKIAASMGVNVEIIEKRNLSEQQNIIDLRRRLNDELEDSTIGLAHDAIRMEELQETLNIIKAYISEFEFNRTRTDLTPEEQLLKMSSLPNIIALINTKEKIISSAQKEMRARKEDATGAKVDFDLTAAEQSMFESLHQRLPILELVVARASVDNGWDSAYMLEKLNKSIYKNFRRGEVNDDTEIQKLKDMTLPYPSTAPVDIEEVITQTDGRDRDRGLMTDRDKDVPKEKLDEMAKKKADLLKALKGDKGE